MNVKKSSLSWDLQKLASPKSVVYVGDIEMIDIEDEVKRRVAKIQAEYGFPHPGDGIDLDDVLGGKDTPSSTAPDSR